MAVQKMLSKLKIDSVNYSAADTDIAPIEVGGDWLDMRDYSSIVLTLIASSGTLGIGTTGAIVWKASALADGSNPVTIRTDNLTADPDAAGDSVYSELSVEEIAQAVAAGGNGGVSGLNTYRYVSANIAQANATGVYTASYIRGRSANPQGDLTTDNVA